MDYPRLCPPRWLFDQDFGMCINPYDILYPYYDNQQHYYRPWHWNTQTIPKECGSTIENDKGNFKITMDVKHFRPNEISVKASDKEIIVEGRHEERADTHGMVTRQFKRRYALPAHCASETVTSTMSSDGVLIIRAEKQAPKNVEKIIPIKLCAVCPRKTETASTSQKATASISSCIAETSKKSEKNKDNEQKTKSQTQIMLREEPCCLLRPEMLKLITSESRQEKVTVQEEKITVKNEQEKLAFKDQKMTVKDEKMAVKGENISVKDEKIKDGEKLALKEENMATKVENVAVKKEANTNKTRQDMSTILTEEEQSTSKIKDILARSSLGMSEQMGFASTSEMSAAKGMSQSMIAQSSTSSHQSVAMKSSATSSKASELVSDVISAELREAAENV